ncbi:MAG: Holliday junction resolvase RuvX [Betaproteobacteria bacterium]|jgi:putative Holliday junction resolvase|nr:Holliday junction resolvase RuvX [Betaproteobacteria bacterium]MDA7751091.1 Holliday junction resolvase RuvX [Methylophilaceae bacterium]MDA9819112.1 Holliday junction resolvase RuvX [Methylophilaceae bacterium]MDC0876882.1 Holliday junction resolvase RuvX [Methylophilaceae bacterium]
MAPSSNIQPNTNVIAFDFGEKKIGVAIGNSITKTAHPLETIRKVKKSERIEIIENLLNEWEPGIVVVGLPLNEDGTESRLTLLAQNFAKKIKNRFKVPIVMVDERYTSVEAKILLNGNVKSIKKGNQVIDQVAAQIILGSYFDRS